MKVGIYKDTFTNNRGADIAVKNFAAGLAERGHVVTLFDKTQFAEKVRVDYDVIISTGTNEILDLAEAEELPPIVQQFHTDPKYPFRHWIKRWRRNRAIKAALRKVSVFQVLREPHVGVLQRLLGGVSKDKIFVIGNWSSFEGCICEDAQAEKVIICPCAINKDKNQTLLVEAFARIAGEFPDWQVHIYGKGKKKDEQALSRLIASHKLTERVLLKGYADLKEAYAKCSFVAFPSKTEGFPLTIIDAAMFSKPTLMINDWIGCGEVAALEDFATGLRKLMTDVDYRKLMGRKSKLYCENNFSKRCILDEWELMFKKI